MFLIPRLANYSSTIIMRPKKQTTQKQRWHMISLAKVIKRDKKSMTRLLITAGTQS